MKKHGIGSKLIALLLVLAMVLPMVPLQAFAAVGDLSNVDTGLTGDIDTSDTISLPIKIYDYENDGMLFEYAEAYAGVSGVAAAKTAGNFGATWFEDYTIRTSVGGSVNTGNYWADVSLALKTGTYANYTRMTWAGITTANWTGNRAGVVMADFTTDSTYTTDQIRYMVVVFRSNVRNGYFTVGLNRANLNGAGTDGNYTGNIAVTTENDTNWTYAVLDLKTGTLGSNWSKGAVHGVYVGLPIYQSGQWMDLAHVAFFADKDQATAFGEYAITDGSDRGDNRGFGLLRGSRTQSGGTNYAGVVDKTDTVYQIPWDEENTLDMSTVDNLGYTLLGTVGVSNIANVGLLKSHLSSEGYPVYKEEVVTYLAGLLQHSLEISERTSDGWKNYRYVKGTPSPVYGNVDLATALRNKINGNMGSYAAASGKDLVGTWAEVGGNINSYYDAAYFLLNAIFYPGSYNEVQDDYDYLVLSAGTDSDTLDKVYVFDGGFSTSATPADAEMAIDYNTTNHTIQNTSAAGKAHFVYHGTKTTTLNPFLPVTDDNNVAGQTNNTYYQDDGVINRVKKQTTKDTLYMRDFNFAMVSEGKFTYYADDELFFEFEGDDDVYLFINGELVMDIGSAHSIDSVRFELNDYVNAAMAGTLGSDERNEALSLEDGNVYDFKFYYMERHSYGSNIRISTNIHVTDPSMVTDKTAWQDGVQLDFGSVVDPKKVVEYGFAITNNGEENLYNLTFTDANIGVKLDPTNGLTVTGDQVTDLNGDTLTASDLTAIVSGVDADGVAYDDITVTFADNAALKAFLTNLTSDAVLENGGGLWRNSTVLIRGIGYTLTDAQVAAGVFDNTVFTTSTNSNKSKTLYGQATMRVYVPADPMYYEWAGHDLKITKAKLVGDVMGAIADPNNPLYDEDSKLTAENVNKIELTTKAGNAISSSYVTIDSSYNLTINYPTAGSKVFYVKITYNSSKNTIVIPVLVNVTDVVDHYVVLDYGLKAVLTNDFSDVSGVLTKNDTLVVPGRTTTATILGMGSNGAYSPNEITFTSASSLAGDAGYGTFAQSGETITYTPGKFLEGYDGVQIAVNVYESDLESPSEITGALDINNEVEMYKSVYVLPANVVYYEDDFPAITYIEGTKNTFTKLGSSSGNSQGVDQDENYGSDDSYNSDADMSGDSLTKVTINQAGPVAKFTFKGTGFELIGRTNAKDSATIELAVFEGSVANVTYDANTGLYTGDGKDPIRLIPVITEFDNGGNGGEEEIYQVPVIRADDLGLGTYTVVIGGMPEYNWDNVDWTEGPSEEDIIATYLYIDGLRIFQPMGSTNEHYSKGENGAEFTEIRDLIVTGQAAAATYNGSEMTIGTGTTTWTENRNGETVEGAEFSGNKVSTVNDYLTMGPNNEVYMDGTTLKTALYFQVKETGNGAHSLQIAVHAVDAGMFYGSGTTGMSAEISYAAVAADGTYYWEPLVTVTSGTEQYYTIDYTKCPVVEGAYQVIVQVSTPEGATMSMASYTSLKTVGMTIANMNTEAATYSFQDGELGKVVDGVWTPIWKLDGENGTNNVLPAFETLSKVMRVETMGMPQPMPEQPAESPFLDVAESDFYYDAVLWAVDSGITNGTGATTFSPAKQVTRAEVVTFLWRAAGSPAPETNDNPFVDVTESDFYYDAVLWAVENGITNGIDADHFGALAICNRAQVVTFLYRASGAPKLTDINNPFADVAEQDFYFNAVLWAVYNGITNGIDADNFGANVNCNRAQIVTFLYRAR